MMAAAYRAEPAQKTPKYPAAWLHLLFWTPADSRLKVMTSDERTTWMEPVLRRDVMKKTGMRGDREGGGLRARLSHGTKTCGPGSFPQGRVSQSPVFKLRLKVLSCGRQACHEGR